MAEAGARPARGHGEFSVSATRGLPFAAETIYGLLADLRRHWPLLGPELVRADLIAGSDGDSAELLLRVPGLPLRRRVVTRVSLRQPPVRLAGEARAGRSVADIEWAICAAGAVSEVSFSALVRPGSRRDAILALGARPWLSSRAAAVLARLERELERAAA
ncbi:MAG: SRPBCC family protein [Solirubrobacterales bacterium]